MSKMPRNCATSADAGAQRTICLLIGVLMIGAGIGGEGMAIDRQAGAMLAGLCFAG